MEIEKDKEWIPFGKGIRLSVVLILLSGMGVGVWAYFKEEIKSSEDVIAFVIIFLGMTVTLSPLVWVRFNREVFMRHRSFGAMFKYFTLAILWMVLSTMLIGKLLDYFL